MRIFLEGNQDLAKWHLPVAEAKFKAFVERCKESGLKQDRFTFVFSEDGTTVYGQYYFGQESLQVYAPEKKGITKERSQSDVSVSITPKVFYVNTSKGYYWVEVRYVDGIPKVTLTPFEAVVINENFGFDFIYPGFALNAPGMIAGNFDDTLKTRYVLAQNGGVIGTDEDKVGVIKSIAVTDPLSRITVVSTTTAVHDFVLMKSDGGKTAEIRRVKISAVGVERFYSSIDMAYEGEVGFDAGVLYPNPCWVHRKCFGSYFSPNKTIGYHVDIGIDDDFLGNMQKITGGDLLDNTGGAGESLFNHAPDLYRFAGLLCFPVSVEENVMSVVMVSPTMGFADSPLDSKKCWGGYGATQGTVGCADYQKDFTSWYLAPRLVKVSIDSATGTKEFADLSGPVGNGEEEFKVMSWDGTFYATAITSRVSECSNDFYDKSGTEEVGSPCTWSEACSGSCGANYDPSGFIGECPKAWSAYEHWSMFFREDIKNIIKSFFLFGFNTPTPHSAKDMHGYYFMFDGLWHLDIGNHWSTTGKTGNSCSICCVPIAGQVPGGTVYFTVNGFNREWIMAHGHEFVDNLEVVASLGYHSMPDAGLQWSTRLGFIAKVPEHLEAPHPPVICTGGVRYPSESAEGEEVVCSRSFASRPCLCDGNAMEWDPFSTFGLNGTYWLKFSGGCPPFDWSGTGVRFVNSDGTTIPKNELEFRQSVYVATEQCEASASVVDACSYSLKKQDALSVSWMVVGPDWMLPAQVTTFHHNLPPGATYTGTLIMLQSFGTGGVLQMPDSHSGYYTASWEGACGSSASKNVDTIGADCTGAIPSGSGAFPGPGAYVQYGVNTIFRIGAFSRVNTHLYQSSWFVGKWGTYFTEGALWFYVVTRATPGQGPLVWDAEMYTYSAICGW